MKDSSRFNKADREGQDKVIPTLRKIFSGATDLIIEQHIEDNGKIDILMTATTSNNNEHWYAIECKDRWVESKDFPTLMIEIKKYNALMDAKTRGYKPLYANTFEDNVLMIWDVGDKTAFAPDETKYCKRTTVEDNGRVNKKCRFLWRDKAIWKGKIQS